MFLFMGLTDAERKKELRRFGEWDNYLNDDGYGLPEEDDVIKEYRMGATGKYQLSTVLHGDKMINLIMNTRTGEIVKSGRISITHPSWDKIEHTYIALLNKKKMNKQ